MNKGTIAILITIAASLFFAFSSCEKADGCGIVRGGYIDNYGKCMLKVEFYDGDTKHVHVDEHTFIHFSYGETICF